MYSIVAADPAVSCNKNKPSLMNFPIIWDFLKQMYTDIPLIVLNIRNPYRDSAEILKLHELGMRLLSNPNKYEYCLLLPSTKYLTVCMVGALLACKICFAPNLPILQQIFGFHCIFYKKYLLY